MFWRADILARSVHLAPAPEGAAVESLVRFEPERWDGRQAGFSTPDGYHMIVAPPRGIEHHLFFADPDPPAIGTKLISAVPFDAWHPDRLEATLSFWRFAHRPRMSPAPRVPVPRANRKTLEAAFLLWALDLYRAGASEREIAEALFGHAPPNWEDTGLRSSVRRFIAKSRRYSTDKWRSLLKPHRRRLGADP